MFVQRSKDGTITGLYACRQEGYAEELPDDHPDVVAHNAPKPVALNSDDLVQILKAKGVVTDEDISNRLGAKVEGAKAEGAK